jgi:hypothetical protein
MSNIPSILDTASFRKAVLEQVRNFSGFNIPEYNQILLSNYTGANAGTIVYKSGGSIVATLTLTWSGDNLTSVTRS